MKTITQILNEMILENKKEIKRLEKNIQEIRQNQIDDEFLWTRRKEEQKIIIEKLIKKVKKITLILSIAIILNTISIIILNLGR